MAKTSGMELYSDEDLKKLAQEHEESALIARTMGTKADPKWEFIAKMALYIVAQRAMIDGLRSQIHPADEKKPGLRQQALG